MRDHLGTTRRRRDGATQIRPGGALVLCVIVWAVCGATAVEAFWVLGVHGWSFILLPAAVSLIVWALLWWPRVVVRDDRLEVRNVVVTHHLPMGAIDDVRLGAMLRIVLRTRDGQERPTVITAWNAPGVGKDRPRDRLSRNRPGDAGPARPGWSERLVRDQRASASFAAVRRWQERSADADRAGAGGAADASAVRSQPNVPGVAAIVAAAALVLLHVIG